MKGLVLSVVIVVAAWLIGAGVGFARAGQKAAAGEPASAPALTEPGAPSQLQAVLAGPRWRSAAVSDVPDSDETAAVAWDWSAPVELTFDLLNESPAAPRRVHLSATAQRHGQAGWQFQLSRIDDQVLAAPPTYHWQPGQSSAAPQALDRVLATLGRSLNALQQAITSPQNRSVVYWEAPSVSSASADNAAADHPAPTPTPVRYLVPAAAIADGRYQILSYHELDEIALFPDGRVQWLRSLAEHPDIPAQHSALRLRPLAANHPRSIPTSP